MGYTNSSLVDKKILSPNHSGKRTHSIDRITPHCIVGQLSVDGIGNYFNNTAVEASCNYGIGTEGKVVLVVEEKNRSWCSSSNDNDQRAVTIECASDKEHPYAFNNKVYNKLIELCVDICKRNGKTKLLWFGDKDKTLNYKPASNEMVLTVHRWFKNKACPGDWMYSRMSELASKVTSKLGDTSTISEKKETITSGSNTSSSNNMYKVQVGAYSQKVNADEQLRAVKAKGFDAFVVQVDGLYKVQAGAYSVRDNAEAQLAKIKKAGFDAFIVGPQGVISAAKGDVQTLKVGDTVKLQKGATEYGKKTGFASWVYDSTLYVREVNGDRIVISTVKTGAITGAVDKKYLTKQ